MSGHTLRNAQPQALALATETLARLDPTSVRSVARILLKLIWPVDRPAAHVAHAIAALFAAWRAYQCRSLLPRLRVALDAVRAAHAAAAGPDDSIATLACAPVRSGPFTHLGCRAQARLQYENDVCVASSQPRRAREQHDRPPLAQGLLLRLVRRRNVLNPLWTSATYNSEALLYHQRFFECSVLWVLLLLHVFRRSYRLASGCFLLNVMMFTVLYGSLVASGCRESAESCVTKLNHCNH